MQYNFKSQFFSLRYTGKNTCSINWKTVRIWSVFGAPLRKLKGEEVENLDSESRDRPIWHIKKLELHNLLQEKPLFHYLFPGLILCRCDTKKWTQYFLFFGVFILFLFKNYYITTRTSLSSIAYARSSVWKQQTDDGTDFVNRRHATDD